MEGLTWELLGFRLDRTWTEMLIDWLIHYPYDQFEGHVIVFQEASLSFFMLLQLTL